MRFRFTSPHPKDFPDDLLYLMQERHNICKFIHLPAQTGSSTVLERMRRGYTREAYLDLCAKDTEYYSRCGLKQQFHLWFLWRNRGGTFRHFDSHKSCWLRYGIHVCL